MNKIVLIIAGLIFIVVTGFITVNITKQIFEKETANLSKEQKDSLTPGVIVNHLTGGKLNSMGNLHKVIWAGHEFEVAYLNTVQYQITGNKDIQFTESGWYAPSYSLPRSKLLDVNLNQKVKLKITADFEGEMKSTNEGCTGGCLTTEKYHFSEFGLYMIDEDGNRMGMRVLGTRHNIAQGNDKTSFKFTGLTVENKENEIILADSTGFEIRYSPDFYYVTTKDGGKEENKGRFTYSPSGTLNNNQKWMLGINCHVNGEGHCKLEIKEIQIMK